MTGRQLTSKERSQRQSAAIKHGATARTVFGPLTKVRWTRLRKSLNTRGVNVTEISPKAWLELRLLVRLLTMIELADAHLSTQADWLLADVSSGAPHPLIDRYTSWLSQAAAIVARLPSSLASAVEDDLGSLLRRP